MPPTPGQQSPGQGGWGRTCEVVAGKLEPQLAQPGHLFGEPLLPEGCQTWNNILLNHVQTVMNGLFQEMELTDLCPLTFVIVITKIQI